MFVMEGMMARITADRIPRITLGLAHVKQALEELIPGLEEPIAITVEGRRAAVLVPYALYMEMARGTVEEEPPEQGGT